MKTTQRILICRLLLFEGYFNFAFTMKKKKKNKAYTVISHVFYNVEDFRIYGWESLIVIFQVL